MSYLLTGDMKGTKEEDSLINTHKKEKPDKKAPINKALNKLRGKGSEHLVTSSSNTHMTTHCRGEGKSGEEREARRGSEGTC